MRLLTKHKPLVCVGVGVGGVRRGMNQRGGGGGLKAGRRQAKLVVRG